MILEVRFNLNLMKLIYEQGLTNYDFKRKF